jgi:hypothetical protein
MPIDTYKLGWSTGGKLKLGTSPYVPGSNWSEGSGDLTLDVLMTAGEITTSRTPVFQNMASIKGRDNNSSIVKVLLADGVEAVTGSIGFDCNRSYMQSFLSWVFSKRKESFSAYIGTEDFQYLKLTSCTWNSITLTASEGSILNCSIAFASNREPTKESPDSQFFESIYKDSKLIPYWQTGALLDNDVLKVSSWTLTINQAVTPQYLNNKNFDLPAYFRIGAWEFQLDVQTLVSTQDYNKIQIGVEESLNPIIMNLDDSVQLNTSASFGGIDAMGNYQLSLTLAGVPSSYQDSASYSKPFSIDFD